MAYVLRHKWYVLRVSFKYGCVWRAIVHDLSKFLPSEWFPYAEYFYGVSPHPDVADKIRAKRKAAFDLAWLYHQRRNLHHHQYWVLNRDDGTQEALEMPDIYVREMLADWTGAGLAIHGKNECLEWYLKERHKMILHPSTREKVESLLKVPEDNRWREDDSGK